MASKRSQHDLGAKALERLLKSADDLNILSFLAASSEPSRLDSNQVQAISAKAQEDAANVDCGLVFETPFNGFCQQCGVILSYPPAPTAA